MHYRMQYSHTHCLLAIRAAQEAGRVGIENGTFRAVGHQVHDPCRCWISRDLTVV